MGGLTPYYADEYVTLYHGDCREVLPQLRADMILADPPYGATALAWDHVVAGWLPLARAALAPSGSVWCFGSLRMFLGLGDQLRGWKLGQDVIWHKHNGSSFHADRFRRVHEQIVQLYPDTTAWSDVYNQPVTTPDAMRRTIRVKGRPPHLGTVGQQAYHTEAGGPRLMRSVIVARSCHGYAVHPTQKPLAVLLPLIAASCPPGGVVLDPFLGSGSTAVAAVQLGRRCIGIDRDERYLRRAIERLRQVVLPLAFAAAGAPDIHRVAQQTDWLRAPASGRDSNDEAPPAS